MRTYLDYNSTAPLRSEAKQAMIEAMNVLGNPSGRFMENLSGELFENPLGNSFKNTTSFLK